MPVDGLVTAAGGLHQRSHLLHQNVAHTDRVALYQFGEHLAELPLHILRILCHLPAHVVCRQKGIEGSVS